MSSIAGSTSYSNSQLSTSTETLPFPQYGHAMSVTEALNRFDGDTKIAFIAPQVVTALVHAGIPCSFTALPCVSNFRLDDATTRAVSARWNPHAVPSLFVDDWARKLSEVDQEVKGAKVGSEGVRVTMITPQTLDDLSRKQLSQGQNSTPPTAITTRQENVTPYGESAFHPIDQVKALFLNSRPEPVTVVEVCMVEFRNEQGETDIRYYNRTLQNYCNAQLAAATDISAQSSAVDLVPSHIASSLRDKRKAVGDDDFLRKKGRRVEVSRLQFERLLYDPDVRSHLYENPNHRQPSP